VERQGKVGHLLSGVLFGHGPPSLAIIGVPAPSVRKPTVRTADEGRPVPVLQQNPPIFKPRLETLRIILAYNPPCAPCSPSSRRISRNETGSYPGGPHCAQYRVQRLSRGDLDDDSTPVSRPLNIAHNTLPQVFARMGLLPLIRIHRGKLELPRG
jgi:hypothetical protein